MSQTDRSALEQLIYSREFIRSEDPGRKTLDLVFDNRTLKAIFESMKRYNVKYLDYPLASGKESIVFKAYVNSKAVAMKVFKMSTLRFSRISSYIIGDRRFEKEKKDRSRIVYLWTRKEYVNLDTAVRAGVSAPKPIGFHSNILLMRYLGTKKSAAVELRKSNMDMQDAYEQVVQNLVLLYKKAGLVHADLSEYNMLVHRSKIFFIDFGQAVDVQHPQADLFLERDIHNVVTFFRKQGVKCDENDLVSLVKEASPT